MRRRLLAVLLPLLALLLVALEVPLARSLADELTSDYFKGSRSELDTALAARIEEIGTRAGRDRLEQMARGYRSTHDDTDVRVVDGEGDAVVRWHDDQQAHARAIADTATAVLEGQEHPEPSIAWPWRRTPFVYGAAIGNAAKPTGAVIAVTDPAAVRARIAAWLAVLSAVGVAVMLAATFLGVLPLTRWILRPVKDLEAAAQRIATGQPEPLVSELDGPPELRGLAATFNRMAARVAVALDRQRGFAADASHQLRNPLTALRLRLDGLATRVDARGRDDLSAAIADADRLRVTIDELLRLARAEATEAELATVDLAPLLAERVDAWRPAFEGRRLRLAAPPAGGCPARCHAVAVEQALDAVIDNARKFADDAAVDVGIERCNGEVRLRVRDHGAGLDAEELELATGRLWRSARHQNAEGTGLGLSIASTLLEASGGRLELSDARPGLAVELVLPAAEA